MTIGAADGQSKRVTLPWKKVPTRTTHRTSEPTGDAVELAISEVRSAVGKRPSADTVIFAALRFAMRSDRAAFIDEVRVVEAGTYTVWQPMKRADPHDLGE